MPVGALGQSPDYGSMHTNSRDVVPDKLTKVHGELEKFLTKIGVETRPLDEASIAGKVDKAYNKYYVTVDKEGNIAFKEKTWYSKFRSAIGQKEATDLKEVFKTIQKIGVKDLSGSDLETYKLLANVTNTIVDRSLTKTSKPSKLTAELETLKLQTQAGLSGAFNTSLYSAFKAGNDDAVNQLIKSGADINGADKDGKTMLHLAAEKGDLELIGKLRDAGADMACKDNSGNSPLHFAAKEGSGKVLQELIDLGVPVSDRNGEGRNPLHLAAQHGNAEAVKVLIDTGSIKVDNPDDSEMTPLHLAVQNKNLEAVEELLKYGANSDTKVGGKDLVTLARELGCDEIAGKLSEANNERHRKMV